MFNLNSTSLDLAKQYQEDTLNNIEKQRLIQLVKQPKDRIPIMTRYRSVIANQLLRLGAHLQPSIATTEPQRKISRSIT